MCLRVHMCACLQENLCRENIKRNRTWKVSLFSSTVCIHLKLDQIKYPLLGKRPLKFHFRTSNPCIFKKPSLPTSFRCSEKSDNNVTWTKQHQIPAWILPATRSEFCLAAELEEKLTPGEVLSIFGSWGCLKKKKKLKKFCWWPGHGPWEKFCLGLDNISLDLTGTVNFTISIKCHHYCCNCVSSVGFWPAFLTAQLHIWQALAAFHSTF